MRYAGDIILQTLEMGELFKLKNVGFSPDLHHNLFSALKVKNRMQFIIDGDETYVIDKNTNNLIQTADCDSQFWQMKFEVPSMNIHLGERESYLLKEESKLGWRILIKANKSVINNSEIWNSKYANNGTILEVESNKTDPN